MKFPVLSKIVNYKQFHMVQPNNQLNSEKKKTALGSLNLFGPAQELGSDGREHSLGIYLKCVGTVTIIIQRALPMHLAVDWASH